ncbi:MAG: Gfo/Idh/MocA family oxidoreductase [Ignavibacteria bacterium]|nr:Gfo/Idh/MocA family oxidoreductase [Ignavibacteria bacterium]MCU7518831.1 Gfo/Idh/MocA family oxidoreductase [Ignavibacteria bacterium]
MLKGAIIGAGKIAQEGHLPAFLDPEIACSAEIVAAVDNNAETVRLARAKFPGIMYYSSVDEMFSREDVDFIDISSPPGTHASLIEEGIRRGVHILCEKPFVLSPFDAERLYPVLTEDPKVFMPVHQYKYSPIWRTFRSEVPEGSLKKSLLQFNVFRTEADKGIAPLGARWRTNPLISGGGILSDTGVHYLYLALWMFGEARKVTSKIFSISHTDYSVEDTALVLLEFDKGIAQISLTWGADRRANSACLVNDSMSLVYNGTELIKHSQQGSLKIPVPDASDKKNYVALYVSLISDFLGQITSGIKDNCHLDEAYKSIRLLHSCYRAAELNQTIAV